MEPRDQITERKIYPPANECIYCGARDVALTDEHTIPEGLGGRHILPKACCKPCQKIINEEFEQYCLRTLFANVRATLGIRSSRKRQPVRHSLRIITHTGEDKRIYKDAADLPRVFALPVFPQPFFMTGRPMTGKTYQGGFWEYFERPRDQILKELGAKLILTEQIWPRRLARFIAKMVHAHAWAVWGPVFEPLLPPIILGQNSRFIEFVGGLLNQPKAEHGDPLIIFPWPKPGTEDTYLVAKIRLFSRLGSPVYYAVIGRLLKPWPLQDRQA